MRMHGPLWAWHDWSVLEEQASAPEAQRLKLRAAHTHMYLSASYPEHGG